MPLQRMIDSKGRIAVVGEFSVMSLRFKSNYHLYFYNSPKIDVLRYSSGAHFEKFNSVDGWTYYSWPAYRDLIKTQDYAYTEDLTKLFRERDYHIITKFDGHSSLVKQAKRFLKEQGYTK